MGNTELKRRLGTRSHGAHEGREGTGTVSAVMVIVLLAILSGAMLMTTLRGKGERTASIRQHQATYTADAGISLAITNLTAGDDTEWIGTELDPLEFAGGEFWTHVEDNGDATYTVTSSGLARGELQVVEAVLEPTAGGIYDNAVFAGNTDNDTLYTHELGGSDGAAQRTRVSHPSGRRGRAGGGRRHCFRVVAG